MKCSEALELISLTVDGEADHRQESMLRFHLNGCENCRRALAASLSISRAVASLPDPLPPADLEARVRARLSSGTFDASPLRPVYRFSLLRRAAVIIPFAAGLILAARVFMPGPAPAAGQQTQEEYMPVPPSAYTRPVTLTTF